jgi:AraC-like DNA-binding protein
MTGHLYRDAAKYWTTPLFPCGQLLTATFRKQVFCRHWHETYVIPVIQAGAQGYWYRGAQHTAPAGTIAAINPGEIHTGERATSKGWVYRAFYPSVAWMEELAATIAGHPVPTPWFRSGVIDDADLARQLISAHVLLERSVDRLEAETALQSGFVSLLARHAESRPRIMPVGRDAARVDVMRDRLGQDLTESLTLSTLAASVGLSPFHAARLFTKTVGMPPHAWRNQLRVGRALQKLRSGATVAEAAASAGFFDQSHFTRHFTRAYGVSPGAMVKGQRVSPP